MDITAHNSLIDDGILRYVGRLADSAIPIWRIYLFGSHADGRGGPDSDIDLAVFLDREEIDGFSEVTEMMKLRWDIDLRLEPHAFAKSDLDDADPFVRDIVEKGRRIV